MLGEEEEDSHKVMGGAVCVCVCVAHTDTDRQLARGEED